jgi:hypothetical protein
MRAALFVVLLCAGGTAFAQESPSPPSPPQQQPQQPAGLYRFTLTNGNVVDGYWVGGDAQNIHVQTQTGVYSLAVVNVRMYAPLAPVTYTPPPAPVTPVEPVDAVEKKPDRPSKAKAGLGVFLGAYLVTAFIGRARSDKDPDAKLAYLPIIGPVLWTASDEDKFGSDGYDWLAMLSTFAQGAAVYGMIDGLGSDPKPEPKKVTVTPVSRRGYGGIAIVGRF